MRLTILGNSAGGPYHGRAYTAQIVHVDQHAFLVDCGEGTQMQLFKYRVKQDHIEQIFISHLHGDHVFGLMGLLTNWCLKKRNEKLQLFSPPGLRELVEHTARVCGVHFPYPIEFCEVDADVSQKVFENAKVEVWTIPLRHRVPCSGWLFREKPRPRNILKEKIEEYALHFSLIPGIKAGADLLLFSDGRRALHEPSATIPENAVPISNEELTLPPPPPRAYAFCSDTAPSDAVAEAVRGVDLLYHEATFTDEHTEEALVSFHSTAAQAADIARCAGAGRLLLGHFSGRYADETAHLEQARVAFPETYAAEEGVRWEVGSPELGQAV
jgi:ribonuclease Z